MAAGNQALAAARGAKLVVQYVVFSGDTAIAAYPPQGTYPALLERADLATRFRPGAAKPPRLRWPVQKGLRGLRDPRELS